MPKPAAGIAKDVASRARGLDLYLRRMERLHKDGAISTRDVERAYAGGFLEFQAYVERSIEHLFLGLLRGRLKSSNRSVRPLISVDSDSVASAVVTGERAYVDWLPYERYALRRAKSFFSSGKPFSALVKSDIEAFEDVSVVRNALAHQSASALRKFRTTFIDGRSIPPSQHRPPAYLRGYHTVNQTRMNYMLSRVVATMNNLC